MNELTLPLYQFFKHLRKEPGGPGIGEYLDFIEAMNYGFGLKSQKDLVDLLKLLWYTPGLNIQEFEKQFKIYFEIEENLFFVQEFDKDIKDDFKDIGDPDIDLDEFKSPSPDVKGNNKNIPLTKINKNQLKVELSDTVELEYQKKVLHKKISYPKDKEFSFSGEYLPTSRREIISNWSFFRERGIKSRSKQIDIQKTVDKIARNGEFTFPHYKAEKKYSPQIWVLIDHGGSMVAFENFAELLGSSFPDYFTGDFKKLYFHNVPRKLLFLNKQHSEALEISKIGSDFNNKRFSILIISDAGAARGNNNHKRVLDTFVAIERIKVFSSSIVWINPLPPKRWVGTTAEHIAKLVAPMYGPDNDSIRKAISVLKGKRLI